MTTTLPPRNSPNWKEAISLFQANCLVRSAPRKTGTLIDAIAPNATFWIDVTVKATANDLVWFAVKTVSVVGWCAAPPLVYALVAPPPDDVPPLVSPYLTPDELQQMHDLFAGLTALTARALERATK